MAAKFWVLCSGCGVRFPVMVVDGVDREVLEFVAAHDLVVGVFGDVVFGPAWGVTADRLVADGLLARRRFAPGFSPTFALTDWGREVAWSLLPAAEVAPADVRRAAGVASLWVMAHQGAFGEPVKEFFSRRELATKVPGLPEWFAALLPAPVKPMQIPVPSGRLICCLSPSRGIGFRCMRC